MSKAFAIGVAATAAVAGAVYYVSPAGEPDLATPPILVDGTPEQTLAKVREITAERYLQHVGGSRRDAEAVRMVMQKTAPGDMAAMISVDSDRILVLRAKARSRGRDRTELDITAELPASRLSTNPALHPYDLKVMAAFADFAATDYVSSILKGQRMASQGEIAHALADRIGFDDKEKRAFSQRISTALREAYGSQGRSDRTRYSRIGPYDPTPPDWTYRGTDPSSRADWAADAAARAAERAMRDGDLSRYDRD